MFELPAGSEIESDFESLTADELAVKYPYIRGDSAKSTQATCRLKAVDAEGENPTYQYITAIDAEGEPIELRSLPNGIRDEIRDDKIVKSVGANILAASDVVRMVTNYDNYDFAGINKPLDFVGYGRINSSDNNAFRIYGISNGYSSTSNWLEFWVQYPKGTSLEQARAELAGKLLTYQLTEHIEIPVQTSGTLISKPGGTVYWEKCVADAGIYDGGIDVLIQDLPIQNLDRLSKIDFETGVETELDPSQAVIAEDGLSFTHPDLADGDIVFFVYYYNVDSTHPEMTAEFYDSRYVIKDSETDTFYKWSIKVENGTPSIELVEV